MPLLVLSQRKLVGSLKQTLGTRVHAPLAVDTLDVPREVLLGTERLLAVVAVELALLVVRVVVHLVTLRVRQTLESLSAAFAWKDFAAFASVFVQLVSTQQDETFEDLKQNTLIL